MSLDLLIVDDDQVTLKVLERRYGSRFAVHVATNAEVALALVERQRIHILLTDLQLPDIDGIELMIRVRAKAPLVRTIVMTGAVRLGTMLGSLQEGAFTFVTKPFGDFLRLDRALAAVDDLIQGWISELEQLRRLGLEDRGGG